MKKPFIIFSVFIILISVLVYSCSTKGDPPVPNHTSNLSTTANTMKFGVSTYSLGFRSCTIDTSIGIHFSMYGKDINSGFEAKVFFYDSIQPISSSTYTVVNLLTSPPLSNGQCFIALKAPLISPTQFVATGGNLIFNPNNGNPTLTITNVPVINIGDSSTSIISGNWSCH